MERENTVWKFSMAGTFVFGRGCASQIGPHARRMNAKRWLIVTDAVLDKLGFADRIRSSLTECGMASVIFREGQPEPPYEVAERAAEFGRDSKADGVIGLGGGSNIDVAKTVAVLLRYGGQPSDYFGYDRLPGPTVPLIAVPTTAGTGSEVSNSSVLTDVRNRIKVSSLSPWLRPGLAVVDPELTDGCPAKVSAHSGIDALVHAIEAYTARPFSQIHLVGPEARAYEGSNPMGQLLAAEAIRLIGRHLPQVVHEPGNREARDSMAWAASLAGMAFSNCGVALVHALEYPVGASVHCSHGEGNGVLLPYVMQFNQKGNESRFAEVATLLGVVQPPDMPDEMRSEAAIVAVRQIQEKIGIRTRLRDLGVQAEQLPGFAERSFNIKRLMYLNPRMPQSSDLLGILQEAF